MELKAVRSLIREADTRIVLFVVDGLGGLAREPGGPTELEVADTTNLDRLAQEGTCGLIEPVGPGITPGSGAGHLGLFGYDPLRYTVGRGVLSALGIGFDLQPEDVAARGNFCTVDADGVITDRRAGRIDTGTNADLCERLREIELEGTEIYVEPELEHRFMLVLRGDDLPAEVTDTDPHRTGVRPSQPTAKGPGAARTARLVEKFIDRAREILSDQERANMVLLRGFDKRPDWPGVRDSYGLRAAVIADYPAYRGVARLVGMDVLDTGRGVAEHLKTLTNHWSDFDFFFLHRKEADSAGEDGDFDRRVSVLEDVDRSIPGLLDLDPDVLIVTGDHSTPAILSQHSWHPVPVVLRAKTARSDGVSHFNERECINGALGPRLPARDLMPIALGHAMRLEKFGA